MKSYSIYFVNAPFTYHNIFDIVACVHSLFLLLLLSNIAPFNLTTYWLSGI